MKTFLTAYRIFSHNPLLKYFVYSEVTRCYFSLDAKFYDQLKACEFITLICEK